MIFGCGRRTVLITSPNNLSKSFVGNAPTLTTDTIPNCTTCQFFTLSVSSLEKEPVQGPVTLTIESSQEFFIDYHDSNIQFFPQKNFPGRYNTVGIIQGDILPNSLNPIMIQGHFKSQSNVSIKCSPSTIDCQETGFTVTRLIDQPSIDFILNYLKVNLPEYDPNKVHFYDLNHETKMFRDVELSAEQLLGYNCPIT